MNVYFIGGTDAPGGHIGPDGKWHPDPGWNPDARADLGNALSVIRAATRIKTPGLAENATRSVAEFVQKELGAHLKGGGVIVLG